MEPSWSYVEPSWGHVGRSWGHVGSCWAILGPSWAYVGPSWDHLGPIGPSWAVLELILGHLGAMLGQGGTPRKFYVKLILHLSKSKKHLNLRGAAGGAWSAAGAVSRIPNGTALTGRAHCPSTGPAGPI